MRDEYERKGAIVKTTLLCSILISLLLGISACSKSEVKSVLDDIARDTYEANERNKYNENKEHQLQTDEPLTYDQYQQEKKELMQNDEVTPSPTERK